MPISAPNLSKFPNHAFIETGTYHGDGVEAALKAGFDTIHTIELVESISLIAQKRFEFDPVNFHIGDSRVKLAEVLAFVNDRCTIWLDAHGLLWAPGGDLLSPDECPLLGELGAIRRHRPDHTILIDDVRLMGREIPITLDIVRRAVLAVNLGYKLSFIAGQEAADILVCQP